MRVFTRKTLREYWNDHSNAEQALKAWFSEAKHAQWGGAPADIKKNIHVPVSCLTAELFLG